MEDLSTLLKRYYQNLYKPTIELPTVTNRVEVMNKKRKDHRQEGAFNNRNIAPDMSPYISPAVKKTKTAEKPKDDGYTKRLEMLKKWQLDRQKRKEEATKNKKPVFKVTAIPVNVGLPNLENVNTEIKGKPFRSKFAPPNHHFRPPPNVKPVNLNGGLAKGVRDNKADGRDQIMTRSRLKSLREAEKEKGEVQGVKKTTSELEKKEKKVVKKGPGKGDVKAEEAKSKTPLKGKKGVGKNEPKVQEVKGTSSVKKMKEMVEREILNVPSTSTIQNNSDVKTPNKDGTPPIYVSPFVTFSRGKNSARKEFEARKSGKSFSSKQDNSSSSPKAGAAYFDHTLDQQISRLTAICDDWNRYKEEQTPPEEAISMIDTALGQTNLLLTSKFQQFRGLVDKCKNQDGGERVTCEDLHGFWDVVYLQVVNVDKRFENLVLLRENHWKEILPEVQENVAKKRSRPPKKAHASVALKEAIKTARMKKMGLKVEEVKVEKTPKRRSSRITVIKSEQKSVRKSSPGLSMMRATRLAKTVETPGKSILKVDGQKSVKSQGKIVLFCDAVDNIENDLNKLNLEKVDTPRRSDRLTRSKLF